MGGLWSSLDNTICQPPKLKCEHRYILQNIFCIFCISIVFSQYLACNRYFCNKFYFSSKLWNISSMATQYTKSRGAIFWGGGVRYRQEDVIYKMWFKFSTAVRLWFALCFPWWKWPGRLPFWKLHLLKASCGEYYFHDYINRFDLWVWTMHVLNLRLIFLSSKDA